MTTPNIDIHDVELEKRAAMFRPWLEEPATQLFFEIMQIKNRSLARQLADYEPQCSDMEGVSAEIRNLIIGNIQGKIKILKEMCHLPHGVLRAYERAVEAAEKKREKKKEVKE